MDAWIKLRFAQSIFPLQNIHKFSFSCSLITDYKEVLNSVDIFQGLRMLRSTPPPKKKEFISITSFTLQIYKMMVNIFFYKVKLLKHKKRSYNYSRHTSDPFPSPPMPLPFIERKRGISPAPEKRGRGNWRGGGNCQSKCLKLCFWNINFVNYFSQTGE